MKNRMMEMAVPSRRKREKTWKGLELRSETKAIGSNRQYFHAVATPNREKPKEEEEDSSGTERQAGKLQIPFFYEVLCI